MLAKVWECHDFHSTSSWQEDYPSWDQQEQSAALIVLSEFMADQTSNESMQRLSQDVTFGASSSPVRSGSSIFFIFKLEGREGSMGRGMSGSVGWGMPEESREHEVSVWLLLRCVGGARGSRRGKSRWATVFHVKWSSFFPLLHHNFCLPCSFFPFSYMLKYNNYKWWIYCRNVY